MTQYHNLDPNDFVGYEDYDGYDDILPHVKPAKAGKSAKPGKNGKDSTSKVKKPVLPVVSQYEGWMIAVLDKLQPGETPSWSKSQKTQLPFSTQELRDVATEQEKRNGNLSQQFRKLCTNQQQIVNRLIAEKNVEEQQANAEWNLLCVKKLHTEQRTAFRTYRINNGMQVIMHRQEKPKEVAESIQQEVAAAEDENIIDLSKPVKLPKKETSPKADKDGEKKVKGDKKKKVSKKEPMPENYEEPWPEYMGEANPFQPHQQQQQAHYQQHQQQQDSYQQHPQQQDFYPQHQQQQQQQQDTFQQHQQQQQQPYQQQEQPPYVDPYHIHEMSGALPNHDGRIPIPAHDFPPEAPMAPQFSHQQPFQPFAGVPQADPMNDARRQDPPAFNPPHFSARHRSRSRSRQEPERETRRDSHSRPRQEAGLLPRRDSVDSDKIRRKEVRKIGEILKTELRGEVRGEIRDALREAAAEDKVRHWPAGGSYPPTTSSSHSTGQDDMWSSPPSSDGRRYSYSTPGTSPDRGERYYQSPRPTGSLHRQDSSGYDPHRQDGRRYHQDRDRVVRPHNSQREHYRDYDRGRSPKYIRERREVVDDYPDAQYHRQQQQRPQREPRVYMEERPRVQRRVTDFAATLPNAEFGRRGRNDVDFTDQRVYGERRGGRERQPVYHHR